MAQPLDRSCSLPQLGKVDHEAGEFWIDNPFLMPVLGKNLSAFEKNRLYLNHKGEQFIEASFASQADFDSDSRSAVVADFNRDAVPDLLVGSDGGGPLRLMRNQMPRDGNWIRLKLTGTRSNRAAIGSQVVVHLEDGRQICRDFFPANGFMGLGPVNSVIGLGNIERIPRLVIRWPSGARQELQDLPVNTEIAVTEGKAEFTAQAHGSDRSSATNLGAVQPARSIGPPASP